jgi:hypothetical protein
MCAFEHDGVRLQVSVHLNTVLRSDSRSLSIPLVLNDRLDLWRIYVTFLCACTPYTTAKRSASVMSGEELRRHLVAILRGDVELHMQIAHAALGSCHADHLVKVFEVRAWRCGPRIRLNSFRVAFFSCVCIFYPPFSCSVSYLLTTSAGRTCC